MFFEEKRFFGAYFGISGKLGSRVDGVFGKMFHVEHFGDGRFQRNSNAKIWAMWFGWSELRI